MLEFCSIVTILLCMLGPNESCVCRVPGPPTQGPVPGPVEPTPDPPPTTTPAPPPTTTPETPPQSAGRTPGDVLDLENWYLTLPSGKPGSPNTIHQPALDQYRSEYFGLNDARNGVVFRTTAGGVTTKNSKYPRSELREMKGKDKAAWSNSSGTHTLTARQAVTALPKAKPELVTAQIHDASDDVLMVRLEGRKLVVQYNDGDSEIVIDPNYVLGTVFDVKIVAANNRIQVFYNNALKATVNKKGTGWYFKSGSYLQSNTSKGDAPSAVGEVVIYSLNVTHSG